MDPPKKKQNAITRYELEESCLEGNVREKKENYDLMSLVMIYLGNHRGTEHNLLKILDVIFSVELSVEEKKRILNEECGCPVSRELSEEVDTMCNYSQFVRKETWKTAIECLISNLNISVEEAMRLLGIPEHEKPLYIAE